MSCVEESNTTNNRQTEGEELESTQNIEVSESDDHFKSIDDFLAHLEIRRYPRTGSKE